MKFIVIILFLLSQTVIAQNKASFRLRGRVLKSYSISINNDGFVQYNQNTAQSVSIKFGKEKRQVSTSEGVLFTKQPKEAKPFFTVQTI